MPRCEGRPVSITRGEGELTSTMTPTTPARICLRCRGCLVEPGTELEVKGGATIVLCSDCNHDLAGWLRTPPRWAQLEPCGAIGDTVVASMHLTGGPA